LDEGAGEFGGGGLGGTEGGDLGFVEGAGDAIAAEDETVFWTEVY
jgi:hypothetical protein